MILLCLTIAEVMALIDKYQAVVIVAKSSIELFAISFFFRLFNFINKFSKTAGCNETYTVSNFIKCVFVKILNSLYPSLLDGRRSNNKNLSIPVKSWSFCKELLDYQKSDNCFSKAHHIAQNKAAMLTHYVETLLNGIHLV